MRNCYDIAEGISATCNGNIIELKYKQKDTLTFKKYQAMCYCLHERASSRWCMASFGFKAES